MKQNQDATWQCIIKFTTLIDQHIFLLLFGFKRCVMIDDYLLIVAADVLYACGCSLRAHKTSTEKVLGFHIETDHHENLAQYIGLM
jgi:hypothetical protein